MALVMFSCRATGPFIMFRETVERIFKGNRHAPFVETGRDSFREDLPDVLKRLEECRSLRPRAREGARGDGGRSACGASYDEERRRIEDGEAAEDEKKDHETIHLTSARRP